MLELLIAEETPSLNEFANLPPRVRWKYPKLRNRWRQLVWAARVQAHPGPPAMLEYARCEVIRYSPGLLDTDNLYGGFKVVGDALKFNKLIRDDTPKRLHLVITQLDTSDSDSRRATVIRLASNAPQDS